MFSRVSYQPLKQKKAQSETEPQQRPAQVHVLSTAPAQPHGPMPSCSLSTLLWTFFKYPPPPQAGGTWGQCPWHPPVTYSYCRPPAGRWVQQPCAWVRRQALLLLILSLRMVTATQGRNKMIFSAATEGQELTRHCCSLTFKPFGPG